MIRSFTIKNFRCFRDLTIEPLERVNLIAGKNNTGKTSLLEALFLHAGPQNPDLPTRLNAFRGMQQVSLDSEGVWGWLFFKKKSEETIELTSHNQSSVSHSLRIRLVEPTTVQPIHADNSDAQPSRAIESITTTTVPRDLLLEFEDTSGRKGVSRATIVSDGIIVERVQSIRLPRAIYLVGHSRLEQDSIQRFSKLEEAGRQGELVDTLRILEPRLTRLAVLVQGGTPIINGDIGIGRLVPFPFMGEGIVRLTVVLLAISDAPGGQVFIDEIENGLHYSVMTKVWQAIGEAARKNDVQVFATTHSWECIRYAHEAFSAAESYDFRLHRLDRIGDDIRAVTYDKEILETAIQAGFEVR